MTPFLVFKFTSINEATNAVIDSSKLVYYVVRNANDINNITMPFTETKSGVITYYAEEKTVDKVNDAIYTVRVFDRA